MPAYARAPARGAGRAPDDAVGTRPSCTKLPVCRCAGSPTRLRDEGPRLAEALADAAAAHLTEAASLAPYDAAALHSVGQRRSRALRREKTSGPPRLRAARRCVWRGRTWRGRTRRTTLPSRTRRPSGCPWRWRDDDAPQCPVLAILLVPQTRPSRCARYRLASKSPFQIRDTAARGCSRILQRLLNIRREWVRNSNTRRTVGSISSNVSTASLRFLSVALASLQSARRNSPSF